MSIECKMDPSLISEKEKKFFFSIKDVMGTIGQI